LQNTTPNETKITDTKMQKTAQKKAVTGTSAHPSAVAPKVTSSLSKGVKSIKHESHKIRYRRDHPKAAAGVATPSSPVLK
jgi:hypothetical protein